MVGMLKCGWEVVVVAVGTRSRARGTWHVVWSAAHCCTSPYIVVQCRALVWSCIHDPGQVWCAVSAHNDMHTSGPTAVRHVCSFSLAGVALMP